MSAVALPFDAATIELHGKSLIEASAGTGKTHAITTLFVRLLLEKNWRPADILVVTFTEAATLELRERVRARVVEAHAAFEAAVAGEGVADETLRALIERRKDLKSDVLRLQEALRSIDEAPISTLHGFCQRVLTDNAFGTRMPFDVELATDLSELYDDLVYDFWQRRIGGGTLGLARQLAALGIGVPALRQLVRERLRNPRAAIIPSISSVKGSERQLGSLLQEAQKRAAEIEPALAFVREHCKKDVFGGGAEMEAQLAETTECLRETDPSRFYVPGCSESLFTSNLAQSFKKSKHKPPAVPEFFVLFEQLVRCCWQPAIRAQHELLEEVQNELPRRKLQAGRIGFEDLLLRLADALRGPDGRQLAQALRERFKAVLVDEVQDTDPVQFEIFDAAFGVGGHPLFLIGDPKQAIYAFRGADVFAYLCAAKDARQFNLSTSYRSDPGVLTAVGELFKADGRFLVPGIGYHDVQAKPGATNRFHAPGLHCGSQTAALDILFLQRKDREASKLVNKALACNAVARVVASDIVRLLDEKATIERDGKPQLVVESDIAVLTRDNAQCFMVQDALQQRGVHAVVIGDKSVFQSEEAAEVQAILAATLDAKDHSELRRALSSSLVGVTGDDLAACESDPQFWQEWAIKFQRWHELWVARGFMQMFRAFMTGSAVAETLLRQVGGERRLTNVLHLAELLYRASREQQLGPAALLAWLSEQRTLPRAAAEQAEIRLESDEAAVKIMTAHLAKGLEFPIVYCPFLWTGRYGARNGRALHRFHDSSDGWRATWDINVDDSQRQGSKQAERWEAFAEEIRVAYVALTRAKHRTTVVWGGLSGLDRSPAAFLFHALPQPDQGACPALDSLRQTDQELCAGLARYVERCAGAAALRTEPWDYDRTRAHGRPEQAMSLHALKVDRAIAAWRYTSSFSKLVKHELGSVVEREEGKDHDQAPLGSVPDELLKEIDGAALPSVPPVSITLSTFPRGSRAGNLFHEIFEEIDFSADEKQLDIITEAKLRSYGITGTDAELKEWREQAVRALKETLQCPLAPASFSLRDVASAKKIAELEFRMPVGSKDFGLTRQRLARVFAEHPSSSPKGAVPPGYGKQIEQLNFRDLSGFLVGFIDLVFEHEGRWYLVDYKTNHLGESVADYGPLAMIRALSNSHYYLQYHIYTLALHRYLKHFLKKYDYEQHFGGVFYLFIKGMHPKAPPGSGVFFEKPPLARITALSQLLEGLQSSASQVSA